MFFVLPTVVRDFCSKTFNVVFQRHFQELHCTYSSFALKSVYDVQTEV